MIVKQGEYESLKNTDTMIITLNPNQAPQITNLPRWHVTCTPDVT